MAVTQAMGIVYNEERLSIEDAEELEEFCFYLSTLLNEKIDQMGLHIVSGAYGEYLTKFTKEEIESMRRFE